ncbi:ABC transporter ATP-binding protein [Sanguibacter suarezii]|uniref:ABC transporter ATP-binding protein n=1 Tax=Sanguibacter suarezii TaxID=60921 RepID=UPI00083054DF|nr:ABC transporter ATP-binding protein [Sanguibacter suarezii]
MTFLRAIGFILSLGYRTDRRRLFVASGLMLVGYLSAPLVGAGLGAFTNAVLDQDTSRAVGLAIGLAFLLIFELMMGHFAHLSYFELGDMQQMQLTDEIAEIAHSSGRIDQFDRPEFAKLLTVATEGLQRVRLALEVTLQLCGMVLQVIVTTVILAMVEPWLVLLPLAAVPPVLLAQRAQKIMDTTRDEAALDIQLSRHLVQVGTTGQSAKEVRLFGAQRPLAERQRAAWNATTAQLWTAHRRAAVLRAIGQVWFALAYALAVFLVVRQAAAGGANIGQVVLVMTLAVQVSSQVAGGLAVLSILQSVGRTGEHIAELRAMVADDPAAAAAATAAATSGESQSASAEPSPPGEVPERMTSGVTLENVSFCYPGKTIPVLHDVSFTVPAGSTLALVGENGAGKSTLVKLLCGLYQPTSGRILVDGVDLATLPDSVWRERVATLFQDFARFELMLRENVGTGLVSKIDDDEALWAALGRARAGTVVDRLADGLDQLLGHEYGNGVDLSGGQWQTLGLARTLMRTDPLLLILDEPAAALDAFAENALFERFVASAEETGRVAGAITVFVSHRFSTVRDADQIIVLDGGSVREAGTHTALMARADLYAELFALQAGAYS